MQSSQDLDSLVSEVKAHLSFILPSNTLFKATAWPAFIAGAEAKDAAGQEWAKMHFESLWKVQPWGLIKGGLAVLEMIWQRGTRAKNLHGHNWIAYMRDNRVDWLIL